MAQTGPMDLDQAIRDIQTCVRHMGQFTQNAGDMTHERMIAIHAILHALGQDLFKRQCQLN